jgi:Fe-S-cluster containining protein
MSERTISLEWFDERGVRRGSRDALADDQGLRFSCSLCGACCTGSEGYVLITDEERDALAARLAISQDEFDDRYTKMTSLGKSLSETPTEHGLDCVFLDRETIPGKAVCGVYEDRPAQCKTWPFWKSNLSSHRAWQQAAAGCPGIDRGRLIAPEQIRESRDVVDI